MKRGSLVVRRCIGAANKTARLLVQTGGSIGIGRRGLCRPRLNLD